MCILQLAGQKPSPSAPRAAPAVGFELRMPGAIARAAPTSVRPLLQCEGAVFSVGSAHRGTCCSLVVQCTMAFKNEVLVVLDQPAATRNSKLTLNETYFLDFRMAVAKASGKPVPFFLVPSVTNIGSGSCLGLGLVIGSGSGSNHLHLPSKCPPASAQWQVLHPLTMALQYVSARHQNSHPCHPYYHCTTSICHTSPTSISLWMTFSSHQIFSCFGMWHRHVVFVFGSFCMQ